MPNKHQVKTKKSLPQEKAEPYFKLLFIANIACIFSFMLAMLLGSIEWLGIVGYAGVLLLGIPPAIFSPILATINIPSLLLYKFKFNTKMSWLPFLIYLGLSATFLYIYINDLGYEFFVWLHIFDPSLPRSGT